MFHKDYRAALFVGLAAWAFAAAGCQTTNPSVANVDKVKGEVSLYSTGDARSSLADPTKLASVKKTEQALKEHLRTHRTDVEAMLALAQVQVAGGDLEAAEKNCFTALRHDLKNRDARKILAEIAIRRKNYDLASIFLTGAGGEAAKDSSILNMMALVELARNDNSGAMALFKKAIQINANDLAARMNLGVLLLKYRQLAQASVEFERVLKAVPNHSDAKLHLAIIMATRGQNDEAKKLLEDVLGQDEKNPLALYNLAVLLRDTQQYDDAMDRLKEYMKSERGKPTDNDQVFALIDDVQKNQAAKGDLSDDEIEAMAAEMGKAQQHDGAPQQVAKAGAGAPAQAPADDAGAAETAATATAAAKPAAQPAADAVSADEPDDAEAAEELQDLEKELSH
jgi:Tfp pilus assembly protein PilF